MFGALPAEVYGAGLIFLRVGGLVMLLPGVGEASVPPRIRLALALILTMAFYPILRAGLPAVPGTVGGVGAQVLIELAIGLAIGTLLRFFLGALAVAGETISLQTTLSFAQTVNPLQGQPTTSVATFLTLLGLTLIFATNLHHMFIAAIVHSYSLFPAGRGFSVADFGQLSIQVMSQTFALGIQLAAPVVVFSLVFNVAIGFIAKAMPQFQIFFVTSPLSVLLGLSIVALTLGVFGLVWVDHFRTFIGQFV